jgi:hypothetical protein
MIIKIKAKILNKEMSTHSVGISLFFCWVTAPAFPTKKTCGLILDYSLL